MKSISRVLSWTAAALLTVSVFVGCKKQAETGSAKPKVAFITNNASEFWSIARAGFNKAVKEFDVEGEFRVPAQGTAAEQKAFLEDLVTAGFDGIAISPVDPANQTPDLNEVAKQTILICHDSDAPDSKRTMYVGTNNYTAGRQAGKMIREVLKPLIDSGEATAEKPAEVVLFVGSLSAQNAVDRKQGIEDELAGKPAPGSKSTEGLVASPEIKIVATRTDNTDRARAKSNVQDVLISRAGVDCVVGLWSYNGPAIADVLKETDSIGKVKSVCFDEEPGTLQGVRDGAIYATIVQKPYEFGYQSVRVLAALARGDKSVIPENKILDTGVLIIKKDNVDEFEANLKRLIAGGAE